MKNKSNKLKILMLNYEFPPLGGGASPVSYEIAKGYAKLGHQVDVVTMAYKDLPLFEKKDNINIYRVPCLRSKKEICHPWEQYTYIRSAKKFLKEHMKTHVYDINHTHFIIPTGVVALWLKKKYNLPYIITSHGSDVLGYNNKRSFKYIYPLVKKQWKTIVKEAKYVTTPSQFLQNKIKDLTKEGNFIVIPNGIDPKKFKPEKKENRILIVARLFENKGVQDILDALKGLDNELKKGNWKIDIVGEGPYRKFLENKVKENNLNNQVKFHGWLDNNSKELKSLYAKSKFFISASYFENMSIVLLEAVASGCTVIASNVGGNPEVISNTQCLFEKQNITELKNKINLALNNNLKPIELQSKFEWSNIIKRFERVLR
ncbi:Glycosyltransferase Gtf1 [uncultured archaeon]|nr:Glycosyltransferase Gtf1 [uncultured archaeon]